MADADVGRASFNGILHQVDEHLAHQALVYADGDGCVHVYLPVQLWVEAGHALAEVEKVGFSHRRLLHLRELAVAVDKCRKAEARVVYGAYALLVGGVLYAWV